MGLEPAAAAYVFTDAAALWLLLADVTLIGGGLGFVLGCLAALRVK